MLGCRQPPRAAPYSSPPIPTRAAPTIELRVRCLADYGLRAADSVVVQSSAELGVPFRLESPQYLVLSWKEGVDGELADHCQRAVQDMERLLAFLRAA